MEIMMKKNAWLLIPIILMFFVLMSIEGAFGIKQDSSMAPNFILKDLKGTRISLSDYKGKVLFLNYWATWCGPCRAEIPDFIEVYDEYKDKGLEILGISVDRISADRVSDFVRKNKMNYPVAMATQELFQKYQPPSAIPTTLVIDGEGKIQHTKVGMMSKSELIDLFNRFSR
jgi:cytochrome c biogenesis protein CcmG/thiol:disulfide interchange protein DsbE